MEEKKITKGNSEIRKKQIITSALSFILILSAISLLVPNAEAQKTSFGLSTKFHPLIGINSATSISWAPTKALNPGFIILVSIEDSSPILLEGPYAGKTSIWPDAKVTFTRPDGTKDVVNGPFKARPSLAQGRTPDIITIYTPNTKGKWSVNFYWPGDANWNAVNQTDTFEVGDTIPKRNTYAMLSMNPYPEIGLNQNLLINAWVTPPPLCYRGIYEGYTFTFTSPSGKSFVVGPMESEGPATVWFDLPLTEIGNWNIKFDYPGDPVNLPSTVTRTITVKNQAVPVGYPDTPLPDEEWNFPINTNNREWRNIAGPWYQAYYNQSQTSANPYTEAPRTAHILWLVPSYGQPGGYIGSPHSIETGGGEEAYSPGDAGLFSSTNPTIRTIMAGRAYYTINNKIECRDMRTGDLIWSVPGTFDVGTRRGRTAALYSFGSSRFIAYDAMTGAVILNVTGMARTYWQDPYVISVSGGSITKWTTEGSATKLADRIMWNVTDILQGATANSNSLIYDDILFSRRTSEGTILITYVRAINLTTGATIYNKSIAGTDPTNWVYVEGPAISAGNGNVYIISVPDIVDCRGYTAFNIKTGNVAWISEQTDYPWGNFWSYMPQANAYGIMYATGYTGIYALNATNGKILWHYIPEDPYHEQPYGSNIAPNGTIYSSYAMGSTGPVIGGGVVFAPATEHSPTFVYRGQEIYAVDAFTGQKIWSIKGCHTPTAIAYGTLLSTDSYNGYTYAFGKGTTETTVSIASKTLAKDVPVLIEGTIMDQSTAQKGTPAIADSSMTAWMEYVHMQQPKPTNATGVTVKVTAIDPNGNTQNIGTTTSNIFGNYAISWTPPVPGMYQVIATFEGSESYYGSDAGTSFVVTEATEVRPIVNPTTPPQTEIPTTVPTQETASPSPTSAVQPPTAGAPTTTYIAIGTAVIVVLVAVAALILRKRQKR